MNTSMKDEPSRQRLGRGLAALLGEPSTEAAIVQQSKGQRRLPLEFIVPNPLNPRKLFSEDDLAGLAESIRKRGVLQPILVRQRKGIDNSYEIIAGERRWRAAQRAGIFDVPVSVIEATDRQALEIAIVENVQRADLNPIEEAQGYQKLCIEFGYSHADLAQEIGKSRSHVANTLRLLNLPEDARQMLLDGAITAGHARALLSVENPGELARQITSHGLSVRDVERLAREPARGKADASKDTKPRLQDSALAEIDTATLAKTLTDILGLAVSIRADKSGGTISIKFNTAEQFERVRSRLE